MMHQLFLLMVSQALVVPFYSFILFSFLNWVISNDLLLSSLILSSVLSSLLLELLCKFFSVVIVFLSSKFSLFVCFFMFSIC